MPFPNPLPNCSLILSLRRSLNYYIRYLEDHIINRIQMEQSINNSWQTIAPPGVLQSSSSLSSTGSLHQLTFKSSENLWDTQRIQVSQDFSDADGGVVGSGDLFPPTDISSVKSGSIASSKTGTNLYESGPDDHNISFSKNGTEIFDFDPDTERSSLPLGFNAVSAVNDFLTVPSLMEHGMHKTRRSNSLTTGAMHHDHLTAALTSSSENLPSAIHKPRSYSLSIESPRSSVTSSGSETRLDDFKPSYQMFQSHQIGMSNIAAWLKSLRLHKYVWIFASFTYEQMMDITEEYLSKLDVTKGARHKLVICIQKLKERYASLVQIESSLRSGSMALAVALEEMTNIIITPMKPIEIYNKEDVANQCLQVLDLSKSFSGFQSCAVSDRAFHFSLQHADGEARVRARRGGGQLDAVDPGEGRPQRGVRDARQPDQRLPLSDIEAANEISAKEPLQQELQRDECGRRQQMQVCTLLAILLEPRLAGR